MLGDRRVSVEALDLRIAGALGVVFLFVLPLQRATTVRLAALFALALLCVFVLRRAYRPPLPLKLPFALWAVLALFSLTYAVDPGYSLGEIKSEIIYGFVAYAGFFYLSWHTRAWTLWLWAVFAALLLLSVMNVGLWFAIGDAKTARYIYNGVGAYTTYLVTVFPFVVFLFFRLPARGRARAALRAVPFVFLVPAYLTDNRWVWVALAVTGVALFPLLGASMGNRLRRRSLVVGLSLLLVASAVFLYFSLERRLASQANTGPVIDQTIAHDPRPVLWRFVVGEIAAHPLTGVGFGLGSFDQAYPQWKQQSAVLFHAHNVFLDAGIQMGAPGIAVMIFLFAAVLRAYARLYQSEQRVLQWIGACGIAMVIGVITKNMTDEFFRRDLALLFWALVGASLGYGERRLAAAGDNRAPAAPVHLDGGAGLTFLVIRRDNIGDLVCTTPLFRALRRQYPRAGIFALVNAYTGAVLTRHPDIDAVYTYDKAKHSASRMAALRALARQACLLLRLRRRRIDYAILAGSATSRHTLRLARWLRPRHIVGYGGAPTRGAIDMEVAPDAAAGERHEVENVFRLLAPFGIAGSPPALRVVPDPAEVAAARARLEKSSSTHTLLGVHVSARELENRWPPANFVRLIAALSVDPKLEFVLFWSPGADDNPLYPGDDAPAAQILRELERVPVRGYATPSVAALIGGLAVCDAVVCCDSGTVHLAAALSKPVVGLYCHKKTARWYPWQVPHALVAAERVGDIEVDTVKQAVARLLCSGGAGAEPSQA